VIGLIVDLDSVVDYQDAFPVAGILKFAVAFPERKYVVRSQNSQKTSSMLRRPWWRPGKSSDSGFGLFLSD